ncbi:MAG: tetratricopeptide repeat protein [Candidatus Sumerlaeaceae bacterium]
MLSLPSRNSYRFIGALVPLLVLSAVSIAQGSASRLATLSAALNSTSLTDQAHIDTPQARAANSLAEQLIQQGRETGDLHYYVKAKATVDAALKAAPTDSKTLRNAAWVATIFHRFEDAVRYATIATVVDPHNASAFGVLSDAYLESGRYEDAEDAAQSMLDLKPSTDSYSRGAHLLWLRGETSGAMALMGQAGSAAQAGSEAEAWCSVQLADMLLKTGQLEKSGALCQDVLRHRPNYRFAHAGLGRVALCHGDLQTAIACFERATSCTSPLLSNLLELEQLYGASKESEKATAVASRIRLLAEQHQALGFSGDEITVALLHAARHEKLADAIRLVATEAKVHRTTEAYAAYAWVLYLGGCELDAAEIAPKALQGGIQDPLVLARMSTILAAANDLEQAATLRETAWKLSPAYCDAYHGRSGPAIALAY